MPDKIASDSPYVAQLYAKLGESIRNGTKSNPGFDVPRCGATG